MVDDTTNDFAGAPRDGIFRWWDPVVAFVGGTLVGVVLVGLLGLVTLAIAMHGGYHFDRAKLGGFLQTSFAANSAALVASDLGLGGVIWLVARRRITSPIAYYFCAVPARDMLFATLTGFALSLAINGGNEILSRITKIEFKDSVVERALMPHGALQAIVAVAVIALFAPFVEEFFFRGLFFSWLRQKGSAWMAILVSAFAFAAVHGQVFVHPGIQGWLYSAELMLAGVVLALWVLRSGSLRTSLATHAAFNATALLVALLVP